MRPSRQQSGRRKHGGRGGRGGGDRRQRMGAGGNDGRRRTFTKLIKDEDAVLSSLSQAQRFVEGMDTFDSKAKLLEVLDDGRNLGSRRIREVLSMIESLREVDTLLMPMLRNVLNDETARPLWKGLRGRVMMTIFRVPSLLEVLAELDAASAAPLPTARTLCSFLLVLAKTFVEARKSLALRALAEQLRDRDGVEEAHVLCAVLNIDENPDRMGIRNTTGTRGMPSSGDAMCWVTDRIPPGGDYPRHDNDHANFRDIKLVPTLQELSSERESWLPLATGENAVIDNTVVRLLDSNFRLLREDAVCSIKSNISEQVRPWRNARVIGVNCVGTGRFGGNTGKKTISSLSFIIQVDPRSGKKTVNWKQARALPHSGIVALCRNGKPVRMGTIVVREHDKKGEWLEAAGGPQFGVSFETEDDFSRSLQEFHHNLFTNERILALNKQLQELKEGGNRAHSSSSQIQLIEKQRDAFVDNLITYDLIEASNSFFSYRPILHALQGMEGVPLADELVHMRPSCAGRPGYLPTTMKMPDIPDFRGFVCNLDNWSTREVINATSLDESQANALLHALTSRVALVQGPPGTGKTFIGALIARMIRQNTDESILCVCYTNHALDQFLEFLLANGEQRMVRIGGRSKSDKLKGYSLKELARHKVELAPDASNRLRVVTAQLHSSHEEIESLIEELSEPLDWTTPNGGVCEFLEFEHPDLLRFLTVPQSEAGFKIIGPKNRELQKDYLWSCWKKGEGFPQWLRFRAFLSTEFDAFWSMDHNERLVMIEQWRQQVLSDTRNSLNKAVENFEELSKEKQAIIQQKDLAVLKDARIIGATTSGAAQNRDILSAKSAGVVIVEEAGEVLEAHVLAALAEKTSDQKNDNETKHLILIGDHKQLRPKVENYKLTTVSSGGHNLDCSLFERLVLSGLPSAMLQVQHRMRPSISEFVRIQTYPTLKDHVSVTKYPKVKGVSQDVVFIDHDAIEDGANDDEDDGHSKTKSNEYEAALCVEILRFFLLQGYGQNQIVVLTPYLGQLLKIMKKMKVDMKETTAYVSELDLQEIERLEEDDAVEMQEGGGQPKEHTNSIRCSTIDNFQGEEADVIIISLVRSNKRGNIGFLKEEQRVNVLLSRARHGLFIVGNVQTLKRSSKGKHVWCPLLDLMERKGQMFRGFPSICQLHPDDDAIELCKPSDFRKIRPNGGCSRPCSFRMDCGHVCPQACHPIDRQHRLAHKLCCEPCRRFPPLCNFEHPCQKLCKDECGPCVAKVERTELPCGHFEEAPRCHDVRDDEAKEKLSKRCKMKVPFQFECGHNVPIPCSIARSDAPVCTERCGKKLECGHQCQNRCGNCNEIHRCKKLCKRILFCGHPCNRMCHFPDPRSPCEQHCEAKCVHSRCSKMCNEPCASCVEPCDWQCEHQGKCPLVCGAPCTRLPCNKRCTKPLECGHQCPTVCGENCPTKKFCQICCNHSKRSHVVDMITMSTYESHDINDDPILILPCGHFYAMSTLDGHMEINKAYAINEASGEFVAAQNIIAEPNDKMVKCCPDCRLIIHSVGRYGRLLRFSELRSLERKHIMSIDSSLELCERHVGHPKYMKKLTCVLGEIEKGPMMRVYEACGGSNQVEVIPPPTKSHIRALQLLGDSHSKKVQDLNDGHYKCAVSAFKGAISVCDWSESHTSGAKVRLQLASFMLTWNPTSDEEMKCCVLSMLEWIVKHEHGSLFAEAVSQATKLQAKVENSDRDTIANVVKAMNQIDDYDYGGSWSDHWYECPNGHPYFIGNCGQAMEESKCIECGARVGGGRHMLLDTNRSAEGVVGKVLSNNV